METIKSLNNTSFNTIFSAFNKAFEDYEMQLNKDELQTMLRRRGFVPELSFGAFENEKLIAFTLNGIGFYNNQSYKYRSWLFFNNRIFAIKLDFLRRKTI